MVQFIETNEGYVNTADIYQIRRMVNRQTYDQKGGEPFLALSCRGSREVGEYTATVSMSTMSKTLELLTSTVVPATAPVFATVISVYDVGGSPEVEVTRYPVAAWRVDQTNQAMPILPDDITDDQTVLIELPDGELLYPNNQIFPTLEAAKTAMLEQAPWHTERRNTVDQKTKDPVSD
jgi:hypothetical protein